ncbi:hypothetical protein KIPB_008375 [Kipferlia bialata]|uniref:Uncharacterized protein n=1 Tax=Kipferlia bialata TaxID=797122 RepID=A0A9K3GLE4_9EUKA|nr:hypothetical protein KIPB_008375 [Kipferlia bialata]|eukprot:g8375.t1
MNCSGAALSLSREITRRIGTKHCILSIVLACALLTYGGVSMFIVAFAVYPLGKETYTQAGLPLSLIPSALALGSFTFTMTMLPGSPQVQNVIPCSVFNTTTFAAPVIGIVCACVMLVSGMWYLKRQAAKYTQRGTPLLDETTPIEGEGDRERAESYTEPVVAGDNTSETEGEREGAVCDASTLTPVQSLPSPLRAVLPILTMLAVTLLCSYLVFPSLDLSYLEQYGLHPEDVIGVWSVIVALVTALVVGVVTLWDCLPAESAAKKVTFNGSVGASLGPCMAVSSVVAFGAVIQAMEVFDSIIDAVVGVSGPLLLSFALAVVVFSGLTGSASGGLTIALNAVGAKYLALATDAGMPASYLHRISAISSGTLDTMPYNGSVVTALSVCKQTHRDSYKDIFVVATIIPLFVDALAIGICSVAY